MILEKSLKIAHQLFPASYNTALAESWTKKHFHYSFIFNRNRLLAIGQNSPHKMNNKVMKFANRWGIDHWREFPFKHAELDAIAKLWGKYHVDGSLKLVVLRLNKYGELRNSRPCRHCQTVLTALAIDKVWYSNTLGEFTYGLNDHR